MLPRNHLDRIHIAFDDHRLVNNAGLLLPATLALHLGLSQLVQQRLDLGDAPGRANTGDKMMTWSHLRWPAATASTTPMRCAPVGRPAFSAGSQGAIHPGHLPAQFPVGPRPPTGPGEPRVAGPGLAGRSRTRRRTIHHRPRFHHLRDLRTGQGGRPPPRLHRRPGLSPAAGRRRRNRRRAAVPAARGPGQHRPRRRPLPAGDGEPGALRWGQRAAHGAGRQRLLHSRHGRRLPPDGCPLLHHHRQHKSLRNLIEAIPEDAWTPIPYWMDGAAAVAETTYTPFQSEPDAAPVRLIVRRVQPTPGSQLALFATYSYHGFITDRDGETLELEAGHRRHAAIENAIRDLKYGVGLNHLPSGRFAANGAWLAVQVDAHNLARWTARIGLGEQIVTTKTPPATVLRPGRTDHPLGTPPHPASAPALACLGSPVQWRPGTAESDSTSSLTPPVCH